MEAQDRELDLPTGVRLHVRLWEPPDAPKVPPFLLVHGLASNARLWDGVGAILARKGHRAIAVDQRGHGRSQKVDVGYDFATLTRDLVAVMDETGLTRPLVVGQSWGGNVVLELGHRHPDRVAGIVGLDGGTIDLQSAFPAWEDCARDLAPPRFDGVTREQIETMMRNHHADWPEAGIQGQLGNFEEADDGTVRPQLTRARHMTILRQLWEQRPAGIYPEIKVPVLLLPVDDEQGEWTASKRASLDRAVAALPNAQVRWFTGRHHDVHAQAPNEVVAALLDGVASGFFAVDRSDPSPAPNA